MPASTPPPVTTNFLLAAGMRLRLKAFDRLRSNAIINRGLHMSRFASFSRNLLLPVAAIVFMVAVPGCGSKVTQENYAKIHEGMTEGEVVSILGKPTATESGSGLISGSKKDWNDGDKTISVIFMGDKVLATQKKGF
jgi:hypothetical protein